VTACRHGNKTPDCIQSDVNLDQLLKNESAPWSSGVSTSKRSSTAQLCEYAATEASFGCYCINHITVLVPIYVVLSPTLISVGLL
jgi:hypothetical protein